MAMDVPPELDEAQGLAPGSFDLSPSHPQEEVEGTQEALLALPEFEKG